MSKTQKQRKVRPVLKTWMCSEMLVPWYEIKLEEISKK